MDRKVTLEGREMTLRANALLPRKYRAFFGRDIMRDMQALTAGDDDPEIDMSVFENIAWLMFKTAGEDVGDSPEEWLATVDDMFSVYMIIPDVVELWSENNKTTSVPAKK